MLIRRSLNLEYFEDLVDLRVPYEQGFPLSHLCEDAPYRPYVDRSWVLFGSQQDLRGPVPKSDNLVGVRFDGKTKSPRQTKIC